MIVPMRNLFVEATDIRSWIANKQLVKLYGGLKPNSSITIDRIAANENWWYIDEPKFDIILINDNDSLSSFQHL
jgi:hypothetical protein